MWIELLLGNEMDYEEITARVGDDEIRGNEQR